MYESKYEELEIYDLIPKDVTQQRMHVKINVRGYVYPGARMRVKTLVLFLDFGNMLVSENVVKR